MRVSHHLKQTVLVLTYNLEISICCITVHHGLSRAGVATFVPNLGVLYSKVTSAVFALDSREQNEEEKYLSLAENTSRMLSEKSVRCKMSHSTITRS